MVDHCANPKCAKPLHYLREGRIFVFDVDVKKDAAGKSMRRVEHYWLCGPCAQTYALERTVEGIRLMPKRAVRVTRPVDLPASRVLAS
jgi:hypothetical protein